MNNYPKYLDIDDIRYNINTDFRYAIEADRIARDTTIGDYERALGIICTLFGTEALNRPDHYEKLLKGAQKYLLCGEEKQNDNDEKPNMSYQQDMDLIEVSFFSDYGIELDSKEMHWWKFNKLINGLSNSELGNCCLLNRIRNLRDIDLSEIKDLKERDKISKMQERFALNREEHKRKFNEEEIQNMNEFYAQMEGKE